MSEDRGDGFACLYIPSHLKSGFSCVIYITFGFIQLVHRTKRLCQRGDSGPWEIPGQPRPAGASPASARGVAASVSTITTGRRRSQAQTAALPSPLHKRRAPPGRLQPSPSPSSSRHAVRQPTSPVFLDRRHDALWLQSSERVPRLMSSFVRARETEPLEPQRRVVADRVEVDGKAVRLD